MQADPRKIVDTTTTPLASSGVYTGPWIDALKYRRVAAVCNTDSATTVLWIQHASSNSAVSAFLDASAAGADTGMETGLKGRYVRMVVLAGATLQTRLSAQLILS